MNYNVGGTMDGNDGLAGLVAGRFAINDYYDRDVDATYIKSFSSYSSSKSY